MEQVPKKGIVSTARWAKLGASVERTIQLHHLEFLLNFRVE